MTVVGRVPDGTAVQAPAPSLPAPSLATWAAGTITRWRTVAWTVGAVVAAATIAMVVLPPAWRARASFTPNVSPSGGGAGRLAGALGALGGGLGGSVVGAGLSASMAGDPSESPAFYQKLLVSRELLTRLLMSRFADYRTDAPGDSAILLDLVNRRTKDRRRALEKELKALQDRFDVQVDNRANLVGFAIDAEDPDLAAGMANRLLQLVNEFNLQQRQTRGRVRRVFLAARVDSTKADLDRTTRALRDFLVENRDWETAPTLKARKLELQRQQDIAEDLYVTTRRDFESARVAEINDAALITVVDSAVAPRKRQFPRIGLTLGVSVAVGLLLGLLCASIGAAFADWAREDPAGSAAVRNAARGLRDDLRALWRRAGARHGGGRRT